MKQNPCVSLSLRSHFCSSILFFFFFQFPSILQIHSTTTSKSFTLYLALIHCTCPFSLPLSSLSNTMSSLSGAKKCSPLDYSSDALMIIISAWFTAEMILRNSRLESFLTVPVCDYQGFHPAT